MQIVDKILFVSQGITDETDALKQAISLARNNKAELIALIISPELPDEIKDFTPQYKIALVDRLNSLIQSALDSLRITTSELSVLIEVEIGGTPAVLIIRHVLKNACNLIVKQAEPVQSGKGFKAVDMGLLRKCPCPVWLSRPISKHRNEIRVAVAIDPESTNPEGRALSIVLLQLSRSLADTCSGKLSIISCWDYAYHDFLRDTLLTETNIERLGQSMEKKQFNNRSKLDQLIKDSNISEPFEVIHANGSPDGIIPHLITDNDVDVLVMGTVARTGIPGFIIGNTAENILQNIGCSLLALKPEGFSSPVL